MTASSIPSSASGSSCASAAIDRYHVVTGGPGAGKTSLIEALAAAGFATVGEAGRAIIQAEVAAGGSALPWGDRAAYAEAMEARDIAAYDRATALDGAVFFDRGLPDLVGYRRLAGLPASPSLEAACATRRYHRRVFIAPPWPDIYATDAERRQTFADAERTYRVMAAVYATFGYELIELPRVGVPAGIAFVRAQLAPDRAKRKAGPEGPA